MRRTVWLWVVLLLFVAASAASAKDQTYILKNDYGQAVVAVPVSAPEGLVPFTPDTNYMSIAGFLRWYIWKTEGTWVPTTSRLHVIKLMDPIGIH